MVIGINNYGNDIRPLTYAVRDADGFARLLVEELGFRKEQVLVVLDPPPRDRCSLHPGCPTGNQGSHWAAAGDELPEKTGPDDRLLIFYAGHGERRSCPSGEQRAIWYRPMRSRGHGRPISPLRTSPRRATYAGPSMSSTCSTLATAGWHSAGPPLSHHLTKRPCSRTKRAWR